MFASLAFVVAAYLIGSVSFAVVISKLFALPDPHSYGSGNPGATNVLRTGNKAAAALTLLGDGAKGWLAVFLAQQLGPLFAVADWTVPAVALAAFVGHLFPLFHGFAGKFGSLLDAVWPQVDAAALAQDEIELVLQVNGKLRGKITVPATADRATIESVAKASPEVAKHGAGAPVKKVVVVPGRLVNVVV